MLSRSRPGLKRRLIRLLQDYGPVAAGHRNQCTIIKTLAAGPDDRCRKAEESPNSAEQCAG